MKGNQIQNLGPVWYMCLNTRFQFLNNVIHIFKYFFTYTYFQKIQTTLSNGSQFLKKENPKFYFYQ